MRNNEGSTMTTANAQLARRFFEEVCNNRQLDIAGHLFSAGHSYHDPASPCVGKGPAGIRELIGAYHRGVADAHWDVRETIESGDTVITRWTGRGTHTGELLGIAPTRKKVNVDGIWIHRIAGGKIVESWNCWDALGMLQQLGVVPQLGARAA